MVTTSSFANSTTKRLIGRHILIGLMLTTLVFAITYFIQEAVRVAFNHSWYSWPVAITTALLAPLIYWTTLTIKNLITGKNLNPTKVEILLRAGIIAGSIIFGLCFGWVLGRFAGMGEASMDAGTLTGTAMGFLLVWARALYLKLQ